MSIGNLALIAAEGANHLYSLKRNLGPMIPKKHAIIQNGVLLTRTALLAIGPIYFKELGRRTGTEAFSFNKEKIKKQNEYLRKHGGMNRMQEYFYDKRNNK